MRTVVKAHKRKGKIVRSHIRTKKVRSFYNPLKLKLGSMLNYKGKRVFVTRFDGGGKVTLEEKVKKGGKWVSIKTHPGVSITDL